MGKFGPKINIISLSNSNMQEFNCDVHVFCFFPEITFLGQFGPEKQNCLFKLKFGTYAYSNMRNSMMVFIFLFEIRNTFFGQIWIFSLSWNLVHGLIRICRMHWWCSLFLFLSRNTLFGQNCPEKTKLSV